jgi:hypothetical protein
VADHLFLSQLVAGQDHLLGVDDHDMVAGIEMGRETGLVLAAQALGDLGRETAKYDAVGVHEPPLARDLTRFSYVGLHSSPSLGAGEPGRS